MKILHVTKKYPNALGGDATAVSRAAAAVAEGGTFAESTADFAEYSLALEKVGEFKEKGQFNTI